MSEQRTGAPATQDDKEITMTLKEGPDDSARSPINAAANNDDDDGTITKSGSAPLSQLISNGSFSTKVVIKDQATPGDDSSTLEKTARAQSLDEDLQDDRQEPKNPPASQPSTMANQTTAAPPPEPEPSSSSSSTSSSGGESAHTDDEGGETATATSVSLSASAGAIVRSPVQVVASSTTTTTRTGSVVADGKVLAEEHATAIATIPARKEDPPGEMAAVATGTKEQEAEVAAPKVVQVPAVASHVDSIQNTILPAEPNIVVAEAGETKTSEDATTREATSSASPSTTSAPFVNQGLALWERARQEWLGSTQSSSSSTATTTTAPTAAATPLDVDEIIDIIFASTRQQVVREVAAAAAPTITTSPTAASTTTTTTSSSVPIVQVEPPRSFPKPVPLPQMIDILVDLWEAEGLDI